MNDLLTILQGDALTELRKLPDECVQMCCTSPPYWGHRNYGHKDQLGQEATPALYVEAIACVMMEVYRVLRADGVIFLNLGDTYAQGNKGNSGAIRPGDNQGTNSGSLATRRGDEIGPNRTGGTKGFCKPKDLIGVPWLVAFALRDAGWYLRSEITWCKKVPMPESVLDRPTAATEKIFLLSKQAKYFYNAEAVRNPPSESFANDSRWKTGSTPNNSKNGYEEAKAQNPKSPHRMFDKQRAHSRRHAGFNDRWDKMPMDHQMAYGSNMRNYWVLGPENYSDAHFATFPSEVPKRCILAGSKPGDVILDCFAGSGTSGMVALELGRKAVLIELNPTYCQLIRDRTNVTPGMAL